LSPDRKLRKSSSMDGITPGGTTAPAAQSYQATDPSGGGKRESLDQAAADLQRIVRDANAAIADTAMIIQSSIEQGRSREAMELVAPAILVARDLPHLPAVEQVLNSLWRLSSSLEGRHKAVPLDGIKQVLEKIHGACPVKPITHRRSRARSYETGGDFGRAATEGQMPLAMALGEFPLDPPVSPSQRVTRSPESRFVIAGVTTWVKIAGNHMATQQWDDAIQILQQILSRYQPPTEKAKIRTLLSGVYSQKSEIDNALMEAREAVSIFHSLFGAISLSSDSGFAAALWQLGRAHAAQGDLFFTLSLPAADHYGRAADYLLLAAETYRELKEEARAAGCLDLRLWVLKQLAAEARNAGKSGAAAAHERVASLLAPQPGPPNNFADSSTEQVSLGAYFAYYSGWTTSDDLNFAQKLAEEASQFYEFRGRLDSEFAAFQRVPCGMALDQYWYARAMFEQAGPQGKTGSLLCSIEIISLLAWMADCERGVGNDAAAERRLTYARHVCDQVRQAASGFPEPFQQQLSAAVESAEQKLAAGALPSTDSRPTRKRKRGSDDVTDGVIWGVNHGGNQF
jgi:tetratricopeptide (TPR) repeat protein